MGSVGQAVGRWGTDIATEMTAKILSGRCLSGRRWEGLGFGGAGEAGEEYVLVLYSSFIWTKFDFLFFFRTLLSHFKIGDDASEILIAWSSTGKTRFGVRLRTYLEREGRLMKEIKSF